MYYAVSIFVILTIAINSTLIFLVVKAKKTFSNSAFILFLLLSSTWLIVSHIADFPLGLEMQYVLMKVDFFLAPIAIWSFLYFIFKFEESDVLFYKLSLIFTGLTSLALSIVSLTTNWVFINVEVKSYGLAFQQGPLDLPYAIILCFILLFEFAILLKFRKNSTGVKRLQYNYISYGAFITILSLVTTTLLLQRVLNVDYNPNHIVVFILPSIGRTSLLCLSVFATLAIIKYKLFGIRMIIGEILFWLLGSSLAFMFFYATVFIETRLFGSVMEPYVILLNILVALLVFPLLRVINNHARKYIRKFSINVSFDHDHVLQEFIADAMLTQTTQQLFTVVFDLLDDCYSPSHIGILLVNKESGDISSEWKGLDINELTNLSQEESVNTLLNNNEYNSEYGLKVPISIQSHDGVLILGTNVKKDAYTSEEIMFIEQIVYYTGLNLNRTL